MVNSRSVKREVSGKRLRKLQAIPGQSMSIQEIVRRFVKGIPMDDKTRSAVYVDQSEHDLEKISRMDFSEKAELAQAIEQDNVSAVEAIRARKREQRAQEPKERTEQHKGPAEGSGIGTLDNTMPVDTKQGTK